MIYVNLGGLSSISTVPTVKMFQLESKLPCVQSHWQNRQLTIDRFNKDIPEQTAVPHWAYQNVSVCCLRLMLKHMKTGF